MKTHLTQRITTLLTAFAVTLLSLTTAIAQDTKKLDVDIDMDKGGDAGFFTQPWVWIVGGAVFILLLVALMRGRGNRAD